jgi:hypothetical protein
MAVSLAKIRGRVRNRLRDDDDRAPVFDHIDVDMAIADEWLGLSTSLPAPMLFLANGLILAAGSETFTLPVTVTNIGYGTGTAEFAGSVVIQRVSDGIYLTKRTNGQIDALRNAFVVPATSRPFLFALYEDRGEILQGRVWPVPKVSETCNLWITVTANDLRDYVGANGTEAMDTATIEFGRIGALALVARTAAALLARMPADAAKIRGLTPTTLALWTKEARDLAYAEEARLHSLKSTGRLQRWAW